MISKELTSKILEEDVENVSMSNLWHMVNIDYKKVAWGDNRPSIINIYQLAHLCKQWARSEGYWIQSGLRGTGGAYAEFGRYHDTDNKMVDSLGYIETEPEAIFAAAQWILDNKERVKHENI